VFTSFPERWIVISRDDADVKIRMAVPADATQIAAVLLESFAEYENLYSPEGFAATTPACGSILNRMKEGPVWIAWLDHSAVGTASVADRGDDLYLRGMAVLPTARGRGIASLLLRQVEDYASAHGYRRLILSTTPFLHEAIRLYERFGFSRSREGPQQLSGTPLFTMVKSL
jgi:GNAT superfamily N-acetyltransferase